jgi:tetratricopeptide (TPR) repeat protein
VRAYEVLVEGASDDRERTALWFKIALVRDSRLHDVTGSEAALHRILDIDPRNLDALHALIRSTRTAKRWPDLVRALDRLARCSPPKDECLVQIDMAEVLRDGLHDIDGAIRCFRRALELDPSRRAAVTALANLYERKSQWPAAIEMLEREAALLGTSAKAAAPCCRVGNIYRDHLSDLKAAKAAYTRAHELDPAHLPTVQALRDLHRREHEWPAYERMLLAEMELSKDPDVRRESMLRLARYHAERKRDLAESQRWYEKAFLAGPESLDAALPLADVATKRGDWAAAERALDFITQRASASTSNRDRVGRVEARQQLCRLGQIREAAGKKDKALESYQRAIAIDPDYRPAQEILARLLVESGQSERAVGAYHDLLRRWEKELSARAAADIRCRIGDLLVSMGRFASAQLEFERALASMPGHESALRGQIAIADRTSNPRSSVDARIKLAATLRGEAGYQANVELGDLARTKLGDLDLAIECYERAVAANRDALDVRNHLYETYRQAGQPKKAVEALKAMLARPALRTNPEHCARVHRMLGETLGLELKDLPGAVAAFNSALDIDPKCDSAFQSLKELLVANQKWAQLAENYRRMLGRIPDTKDSAAARASVLLALADLQAEKLRDRAAALEAYRRAALLAPQDPEIQARLGAFAAKSRGQEQEAMVAYRRALPTAAHPESAVAELVALGLQTRDYDSAFLAAQVLDGILGRSSASTRRVIRGIGAHAPDTSTYRPLTDRLWHSHLLHPTVRGPVGEILALLFEQAPELGTHPHGEYGLNLRKHRIELDGFPDDIALNALSTVASRLGILMPEVFSADLVDALAGKVGIEDERELQIELCSTKPISLKLTGWLSASPQASEMNARAGFELAFSRPELGMARRMSQEEIEILIDAAVGLSSGSPNWETNSKAVKREQKRLRHLLSESAQVALRSLSCAYAKQARSGDIAAYLAGAEISAARAALFISSNGDLVRSLVLDGNGVLRHASRHEVMRDLAVFAAGGDLHALRVACGMDLNSSLKGERGIDVSLLAEAS